MPPPKTRASAEDMRKMEAEQGLNKESLKDVIAEGWRIAKNASSTKTQVSRAEEDLGIAIARIEKLDIEIALIAETPVITMADELDMTEVDDVGKKDAAKNLARLTKDMLRDKAEDLVKLEERMKRATRAKVNLLMFHRDLKALTKAIQQGSDSIGALDPHPAMMSTARQLTWLPAQAALRRVTTAAEVLYEEADLGELVAARDGIAQDHDYVEKRVEDAREEVAHAGVKWSKWFLTASPEVDVGQGGLGGGEDEEASRIKKEAEEKRPYAKKVQDNLVKMKRVEFPRYPGGVATYMRFRRNYKVMVEDNHLFTSPAERLLYLNTQCLGNEAKTAVQYLSTEKEALNELCLRWGGSHRLLALLDSEIASMSPANEMGPRMLNIIEKFRQVHSSALDSDIVDQLASVRNLKHITGLLPNYAKTRLLDGVGEDSWDTEFRDPPSQWRVLSRFLERMREKCEGLLTMTPNQSRLPVVKGQGAAGDGRQEQQPPGQRHGGGAGAGAGGGGKPQSAPPPCGVFGCADIRRHRLTQCEVFKSLTVGRRISAARGSGACRYCLTQKGTRWSCKVNTDKEWANNKAEDCKKRNQLKACTNILPNGSVCGQLHHFLLCSGTRQECGTGCAAEVIESVEPGERALFLASHVLAYNPIFNSANCRSLLTVYDGQSSVNCISNLAARRLRLPYQEIWFSLSGMGGESSPYRKTKKYRVRIFTTEGTSYQISAVGYDTICADLRPVDMSEEEKSRFGQLDQRVQDALAATPSGKVQLLLGVKHLNLFPKHDSSFEDPQQAVQIHRIVLRGPAGADGSPGPEHAIGGRIGANVVAKYITPGTVPPVIVNECALVSRIHTAEMVEATEDSSGIVAPLRTCSSCRACQVCQYSSRQLTLKESEEMQVIEDSIHYDKEKGQVLFSYPFLKHPRVLRGSEPGAKKRLKSLEVKLTKAGQHLVEAYHAQIQDWKERKSLRAVKPEELGDTSVYYPHSFAINANSETTPLRVCVDGSATTPSGVSFNQILPKGPSCLTSLFAVINTFRELAISLKGDLSKMYQSVRIVPEQETMRRLLWRNPEDWHKSMEECPPEVLAILVLTYGDVLGGSTARLALIKVAKMNSNGSDEHKNAIEALENSMYMDDLTHSTHTVEEADRLMDTLRHLTEPAFKWKPFEMSGVTNSEDVQDERVLGLGFNRGKDELFLRVKISPFSTVRGGRVGKELSLKELEEVPIDFWNRRNVYRTFSSIYDPLGLSCPTLAEGKLRLHDIKDVPWDEELPQEDGSWWGEYFKAIYKIEVKIPRHIIPFREPARIHLIAIHDGSPKLFGCVVYIQAQSKEGEWATRFVAAKNRLATKLTVPRSELMAGLMGSNMVLHTLLAMGRTKFDKVYCITDSSIFLSWTRRYSALALREYVGARINNVISNDRKILSLVGHFERLHMKRENIEVADWLTRRNSPDIVNNPQWTSGPVWLRSDPTQWPVSDVNLENVTLPEDEMRLPLVKIAAVDNTLPKQNGLEEGVGVAAEVANVVEMELELEPSDIDFCTNMGERLQKLAAKKSRFLVVVNVIKILLLVRAKRTFKLGANKTMPWLPAGQLHTRAMQIVKRIAGMGVAQKFKDGQLKSLTPAMENGLVFAQGRLRGDSAEDLGWPQKMIICSPSPMIKLMLFHLHLANNCSSVQETLHACRQEGLWLINGRRIARRVRLSCCRHRRFAKPEHQQMKKVSPYRLNYGGPAWSSVVQADYKGPFAVRQFVSQRGTRNTSATRKMWYCGFVCLTSGCVSLEVVDSYDTDSLVVGLAKHSHRHGSPARLVLDKGTQMQCLARQLGQLNEIESGGDVNSNIDNNDVISQETMEWSIVENAIPSVQIEIVPTKSHYCSQVERFFGELEKSLQKTVDKPLTYSQWDLLGHGICSSINSRPLFLNRGESQPLAGDGELLSVTPNDLVLGRPNPATIFNKRVAGGLSQTLKLISQLQERWWNCWRTVVPGLLFRRAKWTNKLRNFKPGDVVFFCPDESKVATYQTARVVKNMSEDGDLVRTVMIEYVAGKKHKKKTRTVSTASLVLLEPVGFSLQTVGDCDFAWEEMDLLRRTEEENVDKLPIN